MQFLPLLINGPALRSSRAWQKCRHVLHRGAFLYVQWKEVSRWRPPDCNQDLLHAVNSQALGCITGGSGQLHSSDIVQMNAWIVTGRGRWSC
jgi:hypothetical protein